MGKLWNEPYTMTFVFFLSMLNLCLDSIMSLHTDGTKYWCFLSDVELFT